jgi:hypothetical protein
MENRLTQIATSDIEDKVAKTGIGVERTSMIVRVASQRTTIAQSWNENSVELALGHDKMGDGHES